MRLVQYQRSSLRVLKQFFKVFSPLCLGLLVSFSLLGALSAESASCDRAYPTVCIPSPPPDLNCSDIQFRNFTVLPSDPHRFDRDRNGIGCESKG